MTETIAINIAGRIAGTISGWNRYVRVNDFVIDTISRTVVATAWPRMTKNSFPIRNRGNTIAETLR